MSVLATGNQGSVFAKIEVLYEKIADCIWSVVLACFRIPSPRLILLVTKRPEFNSSLSRSIQVLKSRIQSSIALTTSWTLSAESGLNARYNCVSPAYVWTCGKWPLIISNSLLAYSVNKNGPKHDPWGTLCVNWNLSETLLSSETRWNQSVRYDLNQRNAVSFIPKLLLRRDKRTECSTVSKTALKSSSTSSTTCWRSMAIRISLCILRSAVSVLCFLL